MAEPWHAFSREPRAARFDWSSRRAGHLWLVALGVLALVAYGGSLRGGYFGDDYDFIFDAPSSPGLFGLFAHPNPSVPWYRPIEGTLLQLVQRGFGLETLPLHLVQLAAHVALASLVFRVALELGASSIGAALGSGYFLLAQCAVLGVASNDTFSQVGGALFGNLALYWLFRALGERHQSRRLHVLSLVAFAAALWSKENGLAFLGGVLVILLVAPCEREVSRLGRLARRIAPYALVTVLYLLARARVSRFDPLHADDVYRMSVGPGILKNVAMLVFSGLLPVSSVDLFLAASAHRYASVAAGAGLALALLGALVYGLSRHVRSAPREERRRRLVTVGALLALYLGGMFPSVLLAHVSELHGYGSLPVLGVLFGLGMSELALPSRPGRERLSLVALALVVASCDVTAIRAKTRLMSLNGERAASMLPQIVSALREAPPAGTLLLVHRTAGLRYSVFLLPGLEVVNLGLARVRSLGGRPDVAVRFVDAADDGIPAPSSRARALCDVDDWNVAPCPAR